MRKQIGFMLKILMGVSLLVIIADSKIAAFSVATNDKVQETSSETATITQNMINNVAASTYVAPVALPAPINQAFPTPAIASAIAQAIFYNSSAVNNTVSQAQLNGILSLTISGASGTLDLGELTAYEGFSSLLTFSVNLGSNVIVTFPENFNTTQFPKIKTMSLTGFGNTTLPDLQLATLESMSSTNLNNLVEIPDFTGLPELNSLSFNYGTKLVHVPDFSHIPKLERLVLTSLGSLKAIPDFQYLPNLKHMNTQYTYLEEAINFSRIPNLTSLSHSSQAELPDYNNLPNLTSLSVMGGLFTKVPDFQYIPEVNYMYLWTSAQTLDVPDFSQLPNMITLTIRGLNSGATTAPTNTVPDFSRMPKMNNLTITGYAIKSVPNFSHMPILTSLTINLTKITAVPNFNELPILKILSLDDNLVPSVPNFEYIPNLERLTISKTLITSIPDFHNMPVLTTLYIQNNRLTTIPSWNFPQLQILYAPSNLITELPILDKMNNLQTLTLSSNKLTTIPNLDLPKLTTLSLDKNNITTLPVLDKLPKMTTFTVGNNQLIELPARVLSFPLASLTPQSIFIEETVEQGEDFTTNTPIVDQIAPKISGFKVRNATLSNRPITISSATSTMLIPTSTLGAGTHNGYIDLGPATGATTINITSKFLIEDTTPPVIIADAEITYEAGNTLPSERDFLIAINASAVDTVDGVVAVTADLSEVKMNVIGNYKVTLSAHDKANNSTTKEVTVYIEDTTAPVISADAEITYEAGSAMPSEIEFLSAINASAEDIVDGVVLVTVDLIDVQMNIIGDYIVTLSAIDSSNNQATKEVTIYITDTTAPIISADTEITYEAGSVMPSEIEFLSAINASAEDTIDGVVAVSADLSNIQMNVVGNYSVVLSSTDSSNNQVTKEVTVHIIDTIAPIINADTEITYEAGTTIPSESEFLSDINASAEDTVDGVVAVTVDLSGIQMNVIGDYIVKLSAQDKSNNSVTKEVTVHIEDTTAPVINADTAITYEAGSVIPSENDFLSAINASAEDIVDGVVTVLVDLSGVQMNVVGDYIVTLNATDSSNNQATKEVIVHIEDTTAPVITADTEITYEAGSEIPSEADFLKAINASAMDAIDGVIGVTTELSSIQMHVVGDYIITLSAIDGSNNQATKKVTVHIVDTIAPVINADTAIIYEAGSDMPNEADFLKAINASAEDMIDGTISVTVELSEIQMHVVGDYLVTLKAVDTSNNLATKVVTVQIEDTTAPIITADTEITYEVGTNTPSEADFLLAVNAAAADVVDGIVPITVDLSAVQMHVVGDYIVILRAADTSNNQATKAVTIHITDTIAPVITANTEITYEAGSELPSEIDFLSAINASAVDAVDGEVAITVVLSSIQMDVVGVYTVTLSAADTSNNQATKDVTIHIVDTIAPVISADTEITYEAGISIPSEADFLNAIVASAEDSIDGTVALRVDLSSVQMDIVGTYTVTLIAADNSNNQATKDVTIHIVDTTAPVISADTEITYEAGTSIASEADFLNAIAASAEDSIDGVLAVVVDLSSVQMDIVGTYTVTLIAVDNSNNQATKDVTIHIVDTTAPVISADTEITYEVGSIIPSEAEFLSAINASATDIVDGIVVITIDLSNLQMNVVGEYTVMLSAVDSSDNQATKEITVHITDTIAPVITADTAITYEAGSEIPSTTDFLTAINALAEDSVDGIVAITVDLSSVQMHVVGEYVVILQAKDTANNLATKEVTVHITDTIAPVITADVEIVYEVGSEIPSEADFLKTINASANDTIDGIVEITVDLSSIQMHVVGEYIVILQAKDRSDNLATKEVIVHIKKTAGPIEETTDPVEETTDPVEETTDPVEETTDPVEETTDPVEETTDPVEETTDPVEETTDPVEETTDPVEETTKSIEEITKPTKDNPSVALPSTGESIVERMLFGLVTIGISILLIFQIRRKRM